VREAMTSVGAQLAHTAGAQYVLAFGHEVGDNPTRAAATAGEMFVARGIARKVLVDLASVSVQARPDGTRRYQSPLFTKKEQYPAEGDPDGVLLSPAAQEVLPDVPVEAVPGPRGLAKPRKTQEATERTTTRMGVAPLVGRDDVLRTLLDSARAVVAGKPTIFTLLGGPGYGKTHLAQMLVQHLEVVPSFQLMFVRAKEVLGGVEELTTRELLRATLGLPDAAPPDLGRALLAEKLGPELGREVWGGVAVSMGWAAPEHPELRAAAAAPGALRSMAARAAGEGLRLKARARPLAVVLEDAHFVDETALDALEYAALAEAAAPIWICVVARPSFGRGRTDWAGRAALRKDLTLPALDPAAAAELADSLSMALLVVLETLSPLERAAFVLREVFDRPYPEVAATLGRSEQAVRQLVHRARGRVDDGHARFRADVATHAQVVSRFLAACQGADLETLLAVLAPDVVIISDGGGQAQAPRRPVAGRDKVARLLMGFNGRAPEGLTFGLEYFNGALGIVARVDGAPVAAMAVAVAGGTVQSLQLIANPEKLAFLRGVDLR